MIFVILAAGLILRLISVNQSLWLDEAIGAFIARDFSFRQILLEFSKVDNHPPFYYLLLKAWSGLFGYSEFALRAPSILLGVGTIYLTYLIGKKLSGKNNLALAAALFLATSQLHVYYSQEARMYALAAFLACLSFYTLLTSRFLIFALSNFALLFSDYMPVFLFPAYIIYGLWEKKNGDWWKKVVAGFVPTLIAGLLWLPTLAVQSGGGSRLLSALPGWKEVAGGAAPRQLALLWAKFVFGRISLVDKKLYLLLVGTASIPAFLGLFLAAKGYRRLKQIFLWLVIPIFLGFLVSFVFPAFNYFRYLYILPAFYILISFGLYTIKSTQVRNLMVFLLVALNFLAAAIYYLDPRQSREMWREAVLFVESRIGTKDVALFEFSGVPAPYRWYSTKNNFAFGAFNKLAFDPRTDRARVAGLLGGKTGLYYFEYLKGITDPSGELEKTIHTLGFREKEVFGNFQGVGFIRYYAK